MIQIPSFSFCWVRLSIRLTLNLKFNFLWRVGKNDFEDLNFLFSVRLFTILLETKISEWKNLKLLSSNKYFLSTWSIYVINLHSLKTCLILASKVWKSFSVFWPLNFTFQILSISIMHSYPKAAYIKNVGKKLPMEPLKSSMRSWCKHKIVQFLVYIKCSLVSRKTVMYRKFD